MMTDQELRRFLEEPGAHLVLNPDLTIHTVGQEFSRITRLPQNATGSDLFHVYAGPPEAVEKVLESLGRVKSTSDPDKMEMVMLCVRIGEDDEERYLRITNIPVLGDNGVIMYIVHRIEDFSQLWEMRKQQEADRKRAKRFISTLFILCVLLMGVISYGYARSSERINHISSDSCQIQKRALPAQRYLANVMHDIHDVLGFPPSPAQLSYFHSLPKAKQRAELVKVKDLNANLANFYNLTDQQPKTRKC